VELSDDRYQHILKEHPEVLPEHEKEILETILSPQQIRKSKRFSSARLFTKWFENVRGGKYMVIVVVSDITAKGDRHWIITAYIARKITEGEIEWKED
jgi:hypothetical protein